MNKRIIITLIIILTLGSILFIFINKKEYKEELSDKKILVIFSYSNYAWSVQINEKVIFNDGTIYSWKYDGSSSLDDYKNNLKEFILKNGKKEDKKVTSKDLNKMEEYIKKTEKIDYKCMGADQGTYELYVIRNDEKIQIDIQGDCEKIGDNNKSLITLINKYLK